MKPEFDIKVMGGNAPLILPTGQLFPTRLRGYGGDVTSNRVLHSLHKVEIDVDEVGSTVRLGSKWSDATPGYRMPLCECASGCYSDDHLEARDCKIVGIGEVTDQWFGFFSDIPARLIANEHEVSSRNYDGLMESMKRAYGENFNEDERVTILVYRRLA